MRTLRLTQKIIRLTLSGQLICGVSIAHAAAPQCDTVLDRVVVAADTEKAFGVASYKRILKVADGMLGSLVIPKETRVEIINESKDERGAGHNSLDHVITAPVAKDAKSTSSVIVHEYGHAIFDKNLGVRNTKYNQLPQIQDRMNRRLLAYAIVKSQVVELKKTLSTSEYELENEKLNAEIAEFTKTNEAFDKLMFVRRAFHELFADTTAVVVKQDLAANSDATDAEPTPAEASQEQKLLTLWVTKESRNFSHPWSPELTVLWKSYIEHAKTARKDPYMWFAPARSFLGEKLKPLLQEPERKRHVLEQVFEILYSEMDQIMAQDGFDQFINNPMVFNLRLQEAFEKLH